MAPVGSVEAGMDLEKIEEEGGAVDEFRAGG